MPNDRPPEAKAGEAWCRVWIPPVKKVLVEKVCVCGPRTEKVVIPAEYGYRPRLCCLSGPKLKEVETPGVWTTKHRDVLVRPEHAVWKRIQCANNPCGECYTKQDCPPVFKKECQSVCLRAPKKCVSFTPAKYKLVDERYEISPARCETRCTPGRYETRTREVCVTPGRWIWRRNKDCEIPDVGLPALEVEMVDSDASGKEAGLFELGSTVRYDLVVRSDVGSEAFPELHVLFTLPAELEFISGGGDGVTVTGSGQSGATSVFKLPLEGEVKIFLLARVLSIPSSPFVQTRASILNDAGEELAVETESTSLAGPGEK